MPEKSKKIIAVVITIVIAYLAFKLLKLLFYAIIIGVVAFIGYNMLAGGSDDSAKLE